ncbi:MAG TPA: tRNA adenosine(34) deaminase TadA [Oligoflexus sp.]|uniref:tRNA adenosine(34) deaminase TadA n=1 Tax=Oligoflexus sp. TaxID=1971216 RepID=UPI002D365687|nr:tRNA adenosine(34) deaminase TadA [Oligoflexus sp.]HYX36951.1 tRNA adenosine(34) deaminase TadA [Oligoflexus sp.]
MTPTERDEKWMRFAQSLAAHAASLGEVPVGAVIVADDRIVATGFNLREITKQATAHAELLAIQEASRLLDSWRLSSCELYVTLEPCVMCSGLIQQARLKRVVFGAYDPKGGALGSLYQMNADSRLNHRYEALGGVLQPECSAQLSAFFVARRRQKLLQAQDQRLPAQQDQKDDDGESP